jgi:hypothetical protein
METEVRLMAMRIAKSIRAAVPLLFTHHHYYFPERGRGFSMLSRVQVDSAEA